MLPLAIVSALPISPRDTVLTAALRFALELAALFAIGAAFGLLNFLIAVFLLSLFNVRGDKKLVGIQVSGPIRLIIEMAIALLGIYSTLSEFGAAWALAFAAVWVGYAVLGRERLVWLARGAR